MRNMVPGIVLASGRSTRMGEPKALLPTNPGGPTFVRRIATSLLEGGVIDALVVGRPDDEALRAEVEAIGAAVRFVANEHADSGQLSSVIAGLNAADRPGVNAILVTPVDAPFVRPGTVRALLEAFASGRAMLVRATYRGRHGHPVIFGRAVFDELRRSDPSMGAKAVVRAHPHELLDFEVDDPGVLDDIDLPEDYTRALDGR
jgi:CTP:molybdopterin cytidylyltransferase MocA